MNPSPQRFSLSRLAFLLFSLIPNRLIPRDEKMYSGSTFHPSVLIEIFNFYSFSNLVNK